MRVSTEVVVVEAGCCVATMLVPLGVVDGSTPTAGAAMSPPTEFGSSGWGATRSHLSTPFNMVLAVAAWGACSSC